jgi:hypothetical protein
MGFTEAEVNSYGFSEVTDGTGLGDAQPQITNGEGRAVENYEIVLQHGAGEPLYCGEVREYGGIANGAVGRINIEHRRVIRTSQIDKDAAAIAVDDEVYFQPGGSGAAGEIRPASTKAAGSIKFGRVTAVGGTGGAYTWLEIRPYSYESSRTVEA